MRAILVLAAFLVFLAGFQLTVFPERTAEWFAWTIDVPMTAVFLGAAYWSSAVLEIAGARSSGWGRARLTVWTVLVFTTLTLVVTLVHLDKFHLGRGAADQRPHRHVGLDRDLRRRAGGDGGGARAPGSQPTSRPPTSTTYAVSCRADCAGCSSGLAGVLLVAGVALLVAPERAADLWSWPLTPLTARAVGRLAGRPGLGRRARLADRRRRQRAAARAHRGGVRRARRASPCARYGDVLEWSSWQAVAYVVVLGWIGLVALGILRAAGAAVPARAR